MMKKTIAILLAMLLILTAVPFTGAFAAEDKGAPSEFAANAALYVHAVSDSADTQAWQEWQSVHDEDFVVDKPNEKYFFLPSSTAENVIDVYNGYDEAVTLNGVTVAAHTTQAVAYEPNAVYPVTVCGESYTLKIMRSNAEAAIYINNPDADSKGTDLMTYLNEDKSLSAKATGAIVTPDGAIDNTAIKKIKGRGNTSWDKPKKGYNITYDKKVSIAGMEKNKKYSILPNYQDDSLSRNRILYDLSDAVGLPYASDSRYVDFYVNGFYWGSYLMCEKIEPGSLVPEVDDKGYLNDDGTVKEDFPFIVEIDASASDDDYWVSAGGMKLTIKAPEIDPGKPGYDEVKAYVRTKFEAFYDATSPTGKLSEVADIDSVAKLYLINELGKNWDSGVSSTFFTYKQDENGVYKFYGSPVWDYDNTLGNAVGIAWDLRSMKVTDYEEYTGWWCRNKGIANGGKRSANTIARISQNAEIKASLPRIWFENFMPALRHFSGEQYNKEIDSELYTREHYMTLVGDSAAMNYESGWLLNTGSWIADHSGLNKAHYNAASKKMIVEPTETSYEQTFEDMFRYACDWMEGRYAWLSEQFAPDYVPSPLLGDVDRDGSISILDATRIQRHLASLPIPAVLDETIADTDEDGLVSITDATYIQRWLANLESNDRIGQPIG